MSIFNNKIPTLINDIYQSLYIIENINKLTIKELTEIYESVKQPVNNDNKKYNDDITKQYKEDNKQVITNKQEINDQELNNKQISNNHQEISNQQINNIQQSINNQQLNNKQIDNELNNKHNNQKLNNNYQKLNNKQIHNDINKRHKDNINQQQSIQLDNNYNNDLIDVNLL